VTLTLSGSSWREERDVTAPGTIVIPLPPPGDTAEIIELEIEGEALGSVSSLPGLRVTWEEGR
jgi:hypothetical protein